MRVKLILPALTEATSPLFRPIKYSLFPPLGLATLAGYLDHADEAEIQDEHVEPLRLDDEPDLVVIQVYITSAYRAYRLADHYRRRGAYVVLGGLHVTSVPEEAAAHADTIFLGPGEDTWPQFLADFRAGQPQRVYRYWWAYEQFYRWHSILRGAAAHGDAIAGLRHASYAAGWKKFEPPWDVIIRAKRAGMMLPVLESLLSEFERRPSTPAERRGDVLEDAPDRMGVVLHSELVGDGQQ